MALRVRHEWPRLYLHLPMWPARSLNQRQDDITTLLGFERMNVVLPRNRTSAEDAVAALEKWRLLSRHHVDVDGLATGLKLAGWSLWAKEVRSRFGQKAGVAAESEAATSEAKEAENASAEAMLGSEIEAEAVSPADNEEARPAKGEMGTPSKSLHDVTSKITGHQNWSRESSTSESIHRGSVVNMDKQSSLNDEDQQWLVGSVGSTTQKGDVIEVPSAEKDILAQESCTAEGSSQKPSMPTRRSGSIANESEGGERNSFANPSGISSDIPSEREEFTDKPNCLSKEHKENSSEDSSLLLSRRNSLSNDETTEKNGFLRQNSRHDSQKDGINAHQNQGANPYAREKSSRTSSESSDSDDNKAQNSFDKDNEFTKHDGWKSCKNFKVESTRSEKDKGISSRKKTLEGNQGEIKVSSARVPLTSEEAAKQKLTDTHLKEEKSKNSKQPNEINCSENIAEVKEDEYPSSCTLAYQVKIGRFQAEDEDDKENAATLKSDSNGRDDKQGSDKISKFSFDANSAKVEGEDSKPQDELPIHEGEDARFDSGYSKKHSPSENDGKGNDISEQFSKKDGPNIKSAGSIQKPPQKSKVPLTGQRNLKNKKNTQPSKDKKRPYRISDEKMRAGSKQNQEELTKSLEWGGHGAESSALSQKAEENSQNGNIQEETDEQVARISMGSEISRKTSTIPKSKKKSGDGKEGSGGNCKNEKKKK